MPGAIGRKRSGTAQKEQSQVKAKLIQGGEEKTFVLVFETGEDKGEPKRHAHVVVGKSVQPTLEVVVVESSRQLRRRMRPEFGVALLDLA